MRAGVWIALIGWGAGVLICVASLIANGQATASGSRQRTRRRTLGQNGWERSAVCPIGVCWLIVALLPVRRWRWRVIHSCARYVLWLTAMPVEIRGLENVVEDSCVLVANHSSYLDGLVLAASLSGDITIVAKKELAPQFVAGTFLRRIDTLFVDRSDPEAGVAETESAARRVGARRRFLFFPEGTFTRVPGLLPFHLGAFAVATQAAVPVVPIAIRGTRSVLRDGQWLPRRGKIAVEIGEALMPEKADFTAAVKLRDHARAFILDHCGEPDRG